MRELAGKEFIRYIKGIILHQSPAVLALTPLEKLEIFVASLE